MVETIFDLVKRKDIGKMEFESYLDCDGRWQTDRYPSTYGNIILICKDNNYEYYLCWNNSDELEQVLIYRKKK